MKNALAKQTWGRKAKFLSSQEDLATAIKKRLFDQREASSEQMLLDEACRLSTIDLQNVSYARSVHESRMPPNSLQWTLYLASRDKR